MTVACSHISALYARPAGCGSGLSSLLLAFSQQLLENRVPLIPDCVCPAADTLGELLDQPHLYWFLAGIAVGILSGPILDLLWVLRERWRRYVVTLLLRSTAVPGRDRKSVV